MESAFPPTYEEATTKDHWSLVASYITGSDLCAACLVSKQWHATFAPFLWGNPAGHFGTENDRVYVALTRFKRALPTASLQVRQLTHTLHLPPALSEIYDGPKAEWLRDVLERLPSLQSLLVSQLPFFDHSALLALRHYSRSHVVQPDEEPPRFPLRLLIASRCSNATSVGLAVALFHLPNLIFLDLSETTAAKDPGVLRSLRHMRQLQVLKLRGLGLRDADFDVVADAIRIRVRSLDVSNNRLTDASVRQLLALCTHSMRDVHSQHSDLRRNHRLDGDWPAGLPVPHDSLLTQLRGNDLDEKFLQRLTKPGAGRIISEDLPASGVTHLYLSNNSISVEAVASLIRTENLHVLDVAAADAANVPTRPTARNSLSLVPFAVPGAEKLTPLLEKHGQKNLTFLRINHALVTQPAGPREKPEGPSELDCPDPQRELEAVTNQFSELDSTSRMFVEMPASVPIFELSAEAPTPRYELCAEPFNAAASSHPTIRIPYPEPEESSPKRGAAFAPEVVQALQEPVNGTADQPTSPEVAEEAAPAVDSRPARSQSDGPSIKLQVFKIEQRREQLRHDRGDSTRGLLPGSLPALSTLVLTEVPTVDTAEGTIITALQKFISDCALEADLANTQAALEFPTSYTAGKPRSQADTHRSKQLFALRQIVLELSPQAKPLSARRRAPSDSAGSPVSPSTPTFGPRINGFNQPERSSTGDPDTEAFWKAQENDFSFFDEEECGQPLRDPYRRLPRRAVEEKMVLPPDTEEADLLSPTRSAGFQATSSPTLQPPEPEGRDVVAELARFRRDRKMLAQRLGRDAGLVPGHWKGEIKIVRPEFSKQKGYVDWYGNYYEKGVYR